MNHPQMTFQKQRQRKFLMLLPLLTVPFIIILFLLLGGGRATGKGLTNQLSGELNQKLPDAQFKKGKDKSKMSLYEEATKDSAIRKEKIKSDPYYSLGHPGNSFPDSSHTTLQNFLEYQGSKEGLDENEKRIMDKLSSLKSVLQNKTESPGPESREIVPFNPKQESLEKFQLKKDVKNQDPQLDQLNGMLDKVMAIQHPEILRDSLDRLALERQPASFAVSLNRETSEPFVFGNADETQDSGNTNRFYDPLEKTGVISGPDNSIEAEIPETQILVSGSTIKLRLLNDIQIAGHLVERNQYIYGTVTLNNERLKIGFSSIRSGDNIFPVSLEAYDRDGLAGIYIPGSINRDVAKQSGDQAINSFGLTSLDPSLAAQAAGAGIQAAKTLISRKVKLVKVTVRAGYRVLLKDSKTK